MEYYNTKKGIEEYILHSQDWKGPKIDKILKKYLPKKSTLLELGIGPGRDLDVLKKTYAVTGSDSSQVFLDRYKKNNKNADLLQLDAVTIPIDRKFDCIYSNKVLHHLTKTELKKSFARQKDVLNQNGIAFHCFWKGDKVEKKRGLLFMYYEIDVLKKIIGNNFDVIEIKAFTEMEKDDSIYVVLKKN